MDKDIRRHIVNLMAPGDHKHREMTEAAHCKSCGHKFVKAQSEYNRLRREYPEKFIRKESNEISIKTQEMNERLQDRIKNDSLYYKHNRILQSGTPEEKQKELKRFWSGFYEKHTGSWRRKIL